MDGTINSGSLSEAYQQLLAAAKETMENSYSPYSRFPVGAALLTDDGHIFTGCNVENANFGSTICAERTAMAKAVSEGFRQFRAIAVVAVRARSCWPCGLCRQFMSEFSAGLLVVVEDESGAIKTMPMQDLLPFPIQPCPAAAKG